MKLTLFVCLMLCSAALVSADPFPKCIAAALEKMIPEGSNIDAMQALDSSGSVGPSGFNKGLAAVKDINLLIDQLTANGITGYYSGTRSGFIQFASPWNTKTKIHLPEYNTVEELNSAISLQTFTRGATAMTHALALAEIEFGWYSDSDSRKKRVLLITDGNNNRGSDPKWVAKGLKKWGVEICVVTIGNSVNEEKLKEIATKYNFVMPNGTKKRQPCICKTDTFVRLMIGVRKAFTLLKPVILQRKKIAILQRKGK